MTRFRADLCLFLAAFIWGAAFVAQKDGNDTMGAIQFVGARFLLSALVMLPFVRSESRRRVKPLGRTDLLLAFSIGLCLGVGAIIQQRALLTTSATNAGFLTALYIALVPLLGWLVLRTPIRRTVLAACALSIFGAWLLSADGSARPLSPGDLMILSSDWIWAVHITLIGIFLTRTHRPYFLAFTQFAFTAVLGIVTGAIAEPVDVAGIVTALPAILFAGVFSGGIAYTLQLVAQRYTPPTEASIILSLESVFAALAGAVMLHERLSWAGIAGCALILGGVLLVRPEGAEIV